MARLLARLLLPPLPPPLLLLLLLLPLLLPLLPPAPGNASLSGCPPDQFQCEPGAICFPREWQCDGHPDCEDEGDEWGCGTATPAEPSPDGAWVTPPRSSGVLSTGSVASLRQLRSSQLALGRGSTVGGFSYTCAWGLCAIEESRPHVDLGYCREAADL
ncbi:CD320 antigen isoform X3 [Ciconia boyciana]|uniref:CD320 antigen isoform X3 n=1 Tax=Ciconia boyciana TaxID=52775 RepID=UPI003BA32314